MEAIGRVREGREGMRSRGENDSPPHTRRWGRKFLREADLRASSPPKLGERELKVTHK